MHLHNPQHEAVCNLPSPLLPEELIVEILLRLPVNSLLKFKCVCKSWKTLISDHQFAKTHLRISTADPSLVSCYYTTESYTIRTYPLMPLFKNQSSSVKPVIFNTMENSSCNIIGSCNGLLCLFNSYLGFAILCNPSIRLISKKSSTAFSDDWSIVAYYGFGYYQLNDKYKVLIVLEKKDFSSGRLAKIYTFGEDSWKTIQNFPYAFTSKLGKFLSGTLNWVFYKSGVSFNRHMILSFDLNKETYEEVLLLQNDGGKVGFHPKLCVWSNCLCVFDESASGTVINIFRLMKDYGVGESWTKLMINPPEKYILKFVELPFYIHMLFVSENAVLLVANKPYPQLVLYNLNSGELELDHPLIGSNLVYDPHIYHESLVSPLW